MLISLDTKDLIKLAEADTSEVDEFRTLLTDHGGRLILTLTVFDELRALFLKGSGHVNVSARLNVLDSMPYRWMRTRGLEERELDYVLRTKAGETLSPIDPVVPSIADCLDGLEDGARAYIERQPLAELPWTLKHGDSFLPAESSLADQYPGVLENDRSMAAGLTEKEYRANLRKAFLRKVAATPHSRHDPSFGDDLWNDPCGAAPAFRLVFTAWHYLVRDTQTGAKSGDLGDLLRLLEIPYVDVFTADKARRSLLDALRTSPKFSLSSCAYWRRCHVLPDLAAVRDYLAVRSP